MCTSSLVFGVATYTRGKYVAKRDYKETPEYRLWKNMLSRCYNKSYLKKYPTYCKCSVSDKFKDFQYFAEWCNQQPNFNKEGWDLDKDIIGDGSTYSEEFCRFVPQDVNKLLIGRYKGEYRTGVHFSKKFGKFKAQCSALGKRLALGYFSTEEEAFQSYKSFKENLIKERVNFWKIQLDQDVYETLMNYEVN